ncbi:MAG: hypothetical protein ABSF71_35555 [Terriglobia bacterium]
MAAESSDWFCPVFNTKLLDWVETSPRIVDLDAASLAVPNSRTSLPVHAGNVDKAAMPATPTEGESVPVLMPTLVLVIVLASPAETLRLGAQLGAGTAVASAPGLGSDSVGSPASPLGVTVGGG